jgi:hypothetical protein
MAVSPSGLDNGARVSAVAAEEAYAYGYPAVELKHAPRSLAVFLKMPHCWSLNVSLRCCLGFRLGHGLYLSIRLAKRTTFS